ncbi:hypothetical protein C1645_783917 [Glomus cerebriforme]|uniref:Uncharacterized protein n=1 Tax=Glomus cerebriforme TaxID=658196 RepID=A0A397SE60_9GLOM|nr:hypothetical protein C1645_783917 [Glomus cerebriforme]
MCKLTCSTLHLRNKRRFRWPILISLISEILLIFFKKFQIKYVNLHKTILINTLFFFYFYLKNIVNFILKYYFFEKNYFIKLTVRDEVPLHVAKC